MQRITSNLTGPNLTLPGPSVLGQIVAADKNLPARRAKSGTNSDGNATTMRFNSTQVAEDQGRVPPERDVRRSEVALSERDWAAAQRARCWTAI